MTKPRVSAEQFVRIWQSAKSVSEAAQRCGTTKAAVRTRAGYYRRKHKVRLKRFPGGRGSLVNGARLSQIAKRSAS